MSLWMRERLQNRGKAQSQTSAAVHLQPLSISVYVISLFLISSTLHLSLSFKYLVSPSCALSLSLFLSLSVFLIFPDLSTLTPGLLPLKECPMQAKAILWLFFERVYFMPLCNIKSRLNQWQSWKLNFWLYFWFYYASNQSFFTGKSLKESLKCCLMAFLMCCSLMWSSLWEHTSWTEQLGSQSVNSIVASDHKGDQLSPHIVPLSISLFLLCSTYFMPLQHSRLTYAVVHVWHNAIVHEVRAFLLMTPERAGRQAGRPDSHVCFSCLAKSREAIDSGLWRVGRDEGMLPQQTHTRKRYTDSHLDHGLVSPGAIAG